MGIEIEIYRRRIGLFKGGTYKQCFARKHLSRNSKYTDSWDIHLHTFFSFMVIIPMLIACKYTAEFYCAFDSTIFLGEDECSLAAGSLRTICYTKGTALYTKTTAKNQIIWASIIESLLMVALDVETNHCPELKMNFIFFWNAQGIEISGKIFACKALAKPEDSQIQYFTRKLKRKFN